MGTGSAHRCAHCRLPRCITVHTAMHMCNVSVHRGHCKQMKRQDHNDRLITTVATGLVALVENWNRFEANLVKDLRNVGDHPFQ